MPGRLNVFQRVMFQWSGLHPYNAGQSAKLAGPLRTEALNDAVRDTCDHNGLGTVEVDPKGLLFQYRAGDAPELVVVRGGESPEATLAEHITRELNRPYDRPVCQPLRFFAVDGGPSAHYVGIIYDHWVADSVAIRLVLRHVLGRYAGLDIPDNGRPLDLYPPTYRHAFGRRWSADSLAGAFLRTVRLLARLRRTYRVAYLATNQMDARFELYPAEPGAVERVGAFARSVGVKVGDVWLAALARALAEFMPVRARRGRRNQLALGAIVDTRHDADVDLSNAMGMFLAYYVVGCDPRRRWRLADLARHVARTTGPIKARAGYLDMLVNMKIGSSVWPRLRDRSKPHFLRRTLTLTAGISNVTLRGTWLEKAGRGLITDHVRIAPVGPLLPLVLTPTTLGDSLNIGLTYRTTGFPRERIDRLMGTFLDLITHPESR